MDSKICTKCNQDKNLDLFHANEYGRFGKNSRCKECYNKAKRKDYRDRKDHHRKRLKINKDARRLIVDEFKTRPCADCAESFHVEVMDLDHLDPEQKVDKVSRLVEAGGIDAVLEELQKCEVVCANCHRLRTARRGAGRNLVNQVEYIWQNKKCRVCHYDKDKSLFYTHKGMADGYLSICKECFSAASGARTKIKYAWIRDYKESNPCKDCSRLQPSEVMDFDHIPGETKLANVSQLRKKKASKEAILAEIAKCDLVCANCHRIRTFNRRQK